MKGILFDLDGTLLDTAPDLTHAMNILLLKYGLSPVSIEQLRPHISKGSAHMVSYCFNISPRENTTSAQLRALAKEFVDIYAQYPAQYTRPFPGVENLISTLLLNHYQWGLVTNKLEHLAVAILAKFPFSQSSQCIIGGDTLPRAKPYPDPLWHAASLLNLNVNECIYVGDSRYDIEAGKAAGMQTILANYGYIDPSEDTSSWNADFKIDSPLELMKLRAINNPL